MSPSVTTANGNGQLTSGNVFKARNGGAITESDYQIHLSSAEVINLEHEHGAHK